MNTFDVDDLITSFNNNVSIIWKPNEKFLNDINIIINELKQYKSFIAIDIYDILVSCGHDLTWNQEYFLTSHDFNWFKNENGKMYFFHNINDKNIINTLEEYNSVINIHQKLCELFELQVSD